MEEKTYMTIWDATDKALTYLRKKGCVYYCNSVPCGYKQAHLLHVVAGGASDKMVRHIKKTYPIAQITFAPIDAIMAENSRRIFKK